VGIWCAILLGASKILPYFCQYCIIISALSLNPFFSGNMRTILNLKIYLELPNHRLLYLKMEHFEKNDVLTLKIMLKGNIAVRKYRKTVIPRDI
jgi:hypothetical protein